MCKENYIFNNSYLKAMNKECPKSVIHSIAKQSYRKKSGGWFSKLFGLDKGVEL